MPKITVPLSDTKIRNAKPKSKEYNLADGGGLFVRVKPSGAKHWLFNYIKPYTKARTNISFGKYPELSLALARAKRDEARALLAEDIDPKTYYLDQEKQRASEIENTFCKFANTWYQLKKQKVKEETANKAFRRVEKHLFPSLGSCPIHNLTPKLLIQALEPVKARGNLETVKRLCRYVNEIMRLAIAEGTISTNYLVETTKLFPAPQSKNMACIKPERLPEFMKALANSNTSITTRLLIEFQLHTMTRPIEAASAEWADIDLQKRLWVIPAERMKMKKPHAIPLSPHVLKILDTMRTISGAGRFVFPGHLDPKKHANSSSANVAIKRMGFKGELVAHGLRSLASTVLNEHGFLSEIIEACLAHSDRNDVRRAYNRAEYLSQRQEIMCWWSEYILKASQGTLSAA
ncbi:integrase domain-containing protein [Pseudoalteromonas sp. T1lg48]|uniref:integrase domain-containing protein n=1 Tax=Pseudoalteromonas sp. T1lg48 TaxID=2077100 RepID=UPI000CF68C24|nr:integrase domain-containing protein [Pseudoalteromonas sp. T1lg48]